MNVTSTALSTYSVHPQLAKDSISVCRWRLSELRLINDLRFTWLILVPQRPNVAEWFELSEQDQQILHEEAMRAASVLKAQTHCTKINIGALGNVVRQLHVHVIARVEGDACWPRPVWGSVIEPMSEFALATRLAEVRGWFK